MLPSNLLLLATHHRPTAITAILLKDCCKDQLEWGKGGILVLERFPRAGEKAPLLSMQHKDEFQFSEHMLKAGESSTFL